MKNEKDKIHIAHVCFGSRTRNFPQELFKTPLSKVSASLINHSTYCAFTESARKGNPTSPLANKKVNQTPALMPQEAPDRFDGPLSHKIHTPSHYIDPN